jgi:hypothetical protein
MMRNEEEPNHNEHDILHIEVSFGEEFGKVLQEWSNGNHELYVGYIKNILIKIETTK